MAAAEQRRAGGRVSTELELKLELDPQSAPSVLQSRAFAQARKTTLPLVSVYYDTPSGKFRKAGFTLRVRSTPQGYVQTVKTLGTSAGFFDRGEWEAPVSGVEPDEEMLRLTPAGTLSYKRLQPIVTSNFERTVWRAGAMEFALDNGHIEASGQQQQLCELEIELLGKDAAEAFEIAKMVSADVPVRLGVLSKAERGFALADGTLNKPVKAQPPGVTAEMDARTGFQAIVASCLRQFRLNEPLVHQQRRGEALHQTRVAMRRLRSALSLFKPALLDAEFPALREELRWFTNQLGTARNLDVLLGRELPDEQREQLQGDRERAYDQVIAALDSNRFRMLMLDILRWATVGEWRSSKKAQQPLRTFAGKRIDRLWERVASREDLRNMDDEGRHELRIEIKKLRYALEFLGPLHDLGSGNRKGFTKALVGLQETLGDLNDLVTADEFTHAGVDTGPDVVDREELIARAQRKLKRLRKAGPYW
jgi:inorganic triphosphatase YgiF